MCTEHWRAYVNGLREARVAAKAAEASTAVEVQTGEADAT
jgi:hypothetical protein